MIKKWKPFKYVGVMFQTWNPLEMFELGIIGIDYGEPYNEDFDLPAYKGYSLTLNFICASLEMDYYNRGEVK